MKHLLSVATLILLAVSCRAENFCFATAETYYEQVYCELVARGVGASLPPLNEFRNNPPLSQALLLKRPARRIGMDLAMPEDATPGAARPAPEAEQAIAARLPCQVQGEEIRCGGRRYRLIGNRQNHALAEGALGPGNRLGLDDFGGPLSDNAAVSRYLSQSYRRYLAKMREIGLAGSTMSFDKFAFLFLDVERRGASFARRAETIFTYLKRDKRSMSVNEGLTSPDLTIEACDRVAEDIVACRKNARNYLFVSP